MSVIDELLSANAEHADALSGPESLPAPPRRQVTIVTCMDCRIDPLSTLGLEPGEAHVLRNAGGVITEDMIRSLAISQRKLGTREVMLIHHSGCGMQGLSEDAFRHELQDDTGLRPSFAAMGFDDVEEDVRASLRRVRGCEFIPYRDAVRGFVLDLATHRLREVEA